MAFSADFRKKRRKAPPLSRCRARQTFQAVICIRFLPSQEELTQVHPSKGSRMVFHQLDHSSSPTFGIEGFDPFECTNSRIMQQDEQGIISNLNSNGPTAEESRYLTGRPAITLYLSCDYFCFSPYQILGKYQSLFLSPLILPNLVCHLTTSTCSVSSQEY